MSYQLISTTESHDLAANGVLRLTVEAAVTANLINIFRNVFPSVSSFVRDTVSEFTAHDETDFNFGKASSEFSNAERVVRDLNFIQFADTLLQTPEGFKGRYPEYLDWLNTRAIPFINTATGVLGAYYQELSLFISSLQAKTALKDNGRENVKMEKLLQEVKEGLGSFFDAKTSNALRTAESLFDRAADITVTIESAKQLNRARTMIKNKEIVSLTKQISSLIDMLVESSESSKIPEVSGAAAKNIAQGAMVAAYYVEFIGVLRYRIEEAINAVGIMSEQVVKASKKD